MQPKERAGRNRTITLTDDERGALQQRIVHLSSLSSAEQSLLNQVVQGDALEGLQRVPPQSVDLAFVDPPYNMNKQFNKYRFTQMDMKAYAEWMDQWFRHIVPALKPSASVYMCGDWRSSAAIQEVMSNYLYIHNRITWEREKGRGSTCNWKNASEDIWFGSLSKDDYYFNVGAVKLKRRVIAPYRDGRGRPKDWDEGADGNFRFTHPSNVWTDLTVPFWSMPENTDHPTQKPEKLVAKVILASSRPNDVILDPFLGSGTTAVVAYKLGRQFYGFEIDEEYCCLARKRLDMAAQDTTIQGYRDGVFWERNSLPLQKKTPQAQEPFQG